VIREFYGLPEAGEKAPSDPSLVADITGFLDLADLLG
jgi:hypothetical protein